jgi:hypothetical protein
MNVTSNQDGMNETRPTRFACDFCGRTYDWKPQCQGRKFKCTCGREFVVPDSGDINQDDLYELAPDERPKPAVRPATSPATPTPFKAGEGAVVAPGNRVQPIQYLQPGTPGHSELDRLFPDRIKDFWLPLWLIIGGAVVEIVYTFVFIRYGPRGLRGAATELGLNVIVTTGIMLVAILIAGKLRQINFGPLPVAVFKLSAVVLGSLGIAHLIGPIFRFVPLFGGMFEALLSFVGYFALMGTLFDLDESDTWYCTCVMVLVWLVAYFGLRAIL